uniref:CARD domain-containing protein n=1 Tax=Plectus sambesii TaxID=2011161 RepID=A0A914XJC6_9BILA
MNEEQRSAINAILPDFVKQANVHPLMDELQHKKDQYGDPILTDYNAVTIRAERNEHEMKRKFIEILKTRQGFHQFVEALIKTEQTAFVHKLNEQLPVAKRISVQAVRDQLRQEKEKPKDGKYHSQCFVRFGYFLLEKGTFKLSTRETKDRFSQTKCQKKS